LIKVRDALGNRTFAGEHCALPGLAIKLWWI